MTAIGVGEVRVVFLQIARVSDAEEDPVPLTSLRLMRIQYVYLSRDRGIPKPLSQLSPDQCSLVLIWGQDCKRR